MKKRRRRLAFSETKIKYMIMGAAIALLVLIAVVSALRGKTPAEFPFGHIYLVSEVVCPPGQTMTPEETPIVYLTADGHLLLESRDRLTFSDAGSLTREEGGWSVSPKGRANQRYRVWLEREDQVMLSFTESGETWTYSLSRADILSCTVASVGRGDTVQLQWFADGVYDSGSFDLVAATVESEGTLTFRMDPSTTDTLTVTEEYHAGDNVSIQTYTLEGDSRGDFPLTVKTAPPKNNEYAVYRVALDGGEYLLQVHFR